MSQVVQIGAEDFQRGRLFVHRARRMQRVPERMLEEMARHRLGVGHQVGGRALRHHAPAAAARARAEVEHVRRAAYGVLVVLDHHQRIALGLQFLQRVEQHAVVARVQADGRLVEDVAHAAQVRAELRREADALRLAAGERGRGALEGEIAEADFVKETQARFQFGDEVARDLGFAPAGFEFAEECAQLRHRQRDQLGDRAPAVAHRERFRVEPAARAGGAGHIALLLFVEEAVQALVLLLAARIPVFAVVRFLVAGEFHAGAKA